MPKRGENLGEISATIHPASRMLVKESNQIGVAKYYHQKTKYREEKKYLAAGEEKMKRRKSTKAKRGEREKRKSASIIA